MKSCGNSFLTSARATCGRTANAGAHKKKLFTMDKAQIVTELRQRVGTTNLSDQTITTLTAPLLPAEGEPGKDFFSRATDFLKTLNGNFSHDVAAQVNAQVDAKANEKFEAFKKDYKPEAPKSIDELLKMLGVEKKEENNGPKTIDELLAIIKGENKQQDGGVSMKDVLAAIKAQHQQKDPEHEALLAQMKEFIEESKKAKAQAAYEGIVESIKEAGMKLNVDRLEWETSLELVTLRNGKNDITSDKMLELVKKEYEKRFAASHPGGDTDPYGNSNGVGGFGGNYAAIKKEAEAKSALKQKAREAQRSNWK